MNTGALDETGIPELARAVAVNADVGNDVIVAVSGVVGAIEDVIGML